MLKWLLNRGFIVKRLVAAATGGLALIFGNESASRIAELLMDPDFIKQAFDWVGMGLMLWAALAKQDVRPVQDAMDSVEKTVTEYLPEPDIANAYPGYDWDPIRGWTKIDA